MGDCEKMKKNFYPGVEDELSFSGQTHGKMLFSVIRILQLHKIITTSDGFTLLV